MLLNKKRALMAPLTYHRTKRLRQSGSVKQSKPSGRKLKFTGVNTEVSFDLASPPILVNPSNGDLHSNVRALVATAPDNTRLRLELLGSRITSEAELDRVLETPDVGVQTLCDADDVAAVPTMAREQLLARLQSIDGDFAADDDVDADELRDLLHRVYTADLRRAAQRRKEFLERECLVRNLLPGTRMATNVTMLRAELRREAAQMAREDGVVDAVTASVTGLSEAECKEKMSSLRSVATVNFLRALGLNHAGTIDELEHRMELFVHVRRRALLLSSPVRPDEMTRDDLVAALDERRITIPFGASDKFLRSILTNQVIRERIKAPIKFPFGVSELELDDLDDLGPMTLRQMLMQARGPKAVQDIARGDRQHLLERLRATILQQNNDGYVSAIRSLLRGLQCFDVIADLDDEGAPWTTWFGHLERAMHEERGKLLLNEFNETL